MLGLIKGPTSAPDVRTQDQVAHVKPNLRPNLPKLRHVGLKSGPSWAQVGANWPEFGASYVLSSLSPGRGRFSSRSDSNITRKVV
jgi:hypothetical protein